MEERRRGLVGRLDGRQGDLGNTGADLSIRDLQLKKTIFLSIHIFKRFFSYLGRSVSRSYSGEGGPVSGLPKSSSFSCGSSPAPQFVWENGAGLFCSAE